jgi:hypothetical protein
LVTWIVPPLAGRPQDAPSMPHVIGYTERLLSLDLNDITISTLMEMVGL